MRFIFKTDYDQDIRLFQHGGQVFWYGVLVALLLAAPFLVSDTTNGMPAACSSASV